MHPTFFNILSCFGRCPARNFSIQIIELAFGFLERHECLLVRRALDLAGDRSSAQNPVDGLEWNNSRTSCTDRRPFSCSVLPALAE
jgi:hypothetical protein